jgi:myosin heavy subunit
MIDEENDEVCVGKGVEDMIKMKTLTQEKILRNLKTRYIQNLIYVRAFSFLLLSTRGG